MDDPRVLHSGHAPTPFSAEEIRRGCPTGRMITARTEAAGQPDRVDVTVYAATDDDGALLESNGNAHRVTWLQLQEHASFPADVTTISDEIIETPLGQMECLAYRVSAGETVSTFWFDKKRPGMPVLFSTANEIGILSTTVVIADDISGAGFSESSPQRMNDRTV